MASVQEYFARKNVLVTGGTGFIGKVLLEKLLRCCPDLNAIYCLTRPKKNKHAHERIKEMFNDKLYDKLRSEQPNFADKVHAITGDVQQVELGIKESDRIFLEDNIHVVFHSAATIRFDEPLRLAIDLNVLGVRRMIKLCKNFKKLEVFQHVSTAYANCDRQQTIEEVIYPTPVEPQKVIDAMEWLDDDMVKSITSKLLGKKPNTYTYTKHLAEHLLVVEGATLPICIIRPSIVTACWREPAPGWIDNYNGPSGLYIAAGKGIMRSIHADPNVVADLVPVDLPVNTMIAAAWYTATHKPTQNALVYQITSGSTNPILWGQMEPIVINFFKKFPMESCFRRPKCTMRSNKLVHDYWMFVSHMIPAYLTDLGLLLVGKNPCMVTVYNKLHKAMTTLNFFTQNEWIWTHDNVDMLRDAMSLADQQTYYMDPRALDWPSYLENYCMGTKIYLMKEDLKGIPAAKAHLNKLRNIRYCFNTVVLVALWRFLIARSNLARNSWQFIMGLVAKFVQFFRLSSAVTVS